MSKTQPATDRNRAASDLFPKGFGEYWHFARHLTKSQQDQLFDSLPHDQREKIRASLHKQGWIDVVMRDRLSKLVDHIQSEYGYNLIDVRCKVLKGKSFYLPRTIWEYILFELQEYPAQHKIFLVGGIKGVACKQNSDVILLVRQGNQIEE